jgi:hypothetical protein
MARRYIMKTTHFLLTVGIMLALVMAFLMGCGGSGKCTEPDSNGMISVGSAIDYDRCMRAAESNKRCVSGGVWSRYDNDYTAGSCSCRAESCEE